MLDLISLYNSHVRKYIYRILIIFTTFDLFAKMFVCLCEINVNKITIKNMLNYD